MSPYGVVLFDLDGTISDSARSILTALRGAFADHDLPPLDTETELSILGPPFHDTLPPYIGNVGILDFIDSYRARYVGQGGMFDTDMFVGVGELIAPHTRFGPPPRAGYQQAADLRRADRRTPRSHRVLRGDRGRRPRRLA